LRGRVTLNENESRRFDVRKGDVFVTRTSETPEEVGYAAVMLDEVDDCVFSGFLLRGRPVTDKLDIGYCQYAFMTEDIRKSIISVCTYTTRALTNGRQLSAIEIVLPENSEQQRISATLSDTDALLVAMEKLIAKKHAIKQGAMQELLTGKLRLQWFEGEWMETTLGDCLTEIIGGGTPSRSNSFFWNGGIPWVTVKDFSTFDSHSTQEYISDIGLCNSATHLIPKGIPIIATRMGLGQIVVYDVDVTINQDLKALILNNTTDASYFVFWFRSKKANFEALGTGSTVKGITLEQLIPICIQDKTNL
jgi:type I restriction enzyme S subunit